MPSKIQKSEFSLRGRIRSIESALNGIAIMMRTQHNAWIHAAATVVVFVAGTAFSVSIEEWRWLILAIAFVWTAEAFNTALECLTDLASPAFNPIAGRAKDVAAGAVFIAAIGAACIGVTVFGPHLKAWLKWSGV